VDEAQKVEVKKVANGYMVTQGDTIHVLHGFDSHAALGKVIAAALGEAQIVTKRKPRQQRAVAAVQVGVQN
jgi:hypothetical protein